MLILYKVCRRIEDEEMPLSSFCEACPALTGKVENSVRRENNKPISLMNTDMKSNTLLLIQIQQYIKMLIYHYHVGFALEIQGCFNI